MADVSPSGSQDLWPAGEHELHIASDDCPCRPGIVTSPLATVPGLKMKTRSHRSFETGEVR